MDKSNFYYPKNQSNHELRRSFMVNRLEKYEQIKKRIEKIYLVKPKKNLTKSMSFIQTQGKIMNLVKKVKVVYKDKRTSIDSEFSDPSEYRITSIFYPNSLVSSWKEN